MYQLSHMALLGTLLLALNACNAAPPPANNARVDVPVAVTPAPVQADKTTIIGQVLSASDNKPMSTVVRLAELVEQNGKQVMYFDGARSPGTQTNQDGTFAIENIDVKKYIVVVGDVPNNNYVIISEAQDKARIYETTAGAVTNVGELRVKLPA